MRNSVASAVIFSVIALGVLGAQSNPTIKHVPLTPTSPVSGKEMFATYCAVCHGADGKGGGPAAAALKTQP
jgi:mono/diheme cytochrome c family protein